MNPVQHHPVSRSVGRPRQFEEVDVLHAAMDVFWRQGYEGTSMADLLAATGLHKGSLYQAFGDKHTLFVRALRHYTERLRAEVDKSMQNGDSALEGLRDGLYTAIDLCCVGPSDNPGCLALNTLAEKGTTDPEVLSVLQGEFLHRHTKITDAVQRAQADGDIRADWPAERIAGLIRTQLVGLAISLKGPLGPEAAKAMVDDLLATLA
jgi:TetR/AcrR family transcriptional repressor of nem operon